MKTLAWVRELFERALLLSAASEELTSLIAKALGPIEESSRAIGLAALLKTYEGDQATVTEVIKIIDYVRDRLEARQLSKCLDQKEIPLTTEAASQLDDNQFIRLLDCQMSPHCGKKPNESEQAGFGGNSARLAHGVPEKTAAPAVDNNQESDSISDMLASFLLAPNRGSGNVNFPSFSQQTSAPQVAKEPETQRAPPMAVPQGTGTQDEKIQPESIQEDWNENTTEDTSQNTASIQTPGLATSIIQEMAATVTAGFIQDALDAGSKGERPEDLKEKSLSPDDLPSPTLKFPGPLLSNQELSGPNFPEPYQTCYAGSGATRVEYVDLDLLPPLESVIIDYGMTASGATGRTEAAGGTGSSVSLKKTRRL